MVMEAVIEVRNMGERRQARLTGAEALELGSACLYLEAFGRSRRAKLARGPVKRPA